MSSDCMSNNRMGYMGHKVFKLPALISLLLSCLLQLQSLYAQAYSEEYVEEKKAWIQLISATIHTASGEG